MNIFGIQLVLIIFGLFINYLLFSYGNDIVEGNNFLEVFLVLWFAYLRFLLFFWVSVSLVRWLFVVCVSDLSVIFGFVLVRFAVESRGESVRGFGDKIGSVVKKIQ